MATRPSWTCRHSWTGRARSPASGTSARSEMPKRPMRPPRGPRHAGPDRTARDAAVWPGTAMEASMNRTRVVIMGAAGRDFHDFNVVYRSGPDTEVIAFTATQIPGIANRRYPPELAGELYPEGIPIVAEDELETLIRERGVDTVVFAYSDVSHETVMHAASRALAAGADFELLPPPPTILQSRRPVVAVCAIPTGSVNNH